MPILIGLGMIKNGKVDLAQFYSSSAYTKDFSSFDGLDVSKSEGKNIHLISMNADNAGVDATRGKYKFNGAAFKIFHEIDAHIDKYTNGDAAAEHEKHGYEVVTKELNGQKVEMTSIKKGSDAWNMMIELINHNVYVYTRKAKDGYLYVNEGLSNHIKSKCYNMNELAIMYLIFNKWEFYRQQKRSICPFVTKKEKHCGC